MQYPQCTLQCPQYHTLLLAGPRMCKVSFESKGVAGPAREGPREDTFLAPVPGQVAQPCVMRYPALGAFAHSITVTVPAVLAVLTLPTVPNVPTTACTAWTNCADRAGCAHRGMAGGRSRAMQL